MAKFIMVQGTMSNSGKSFVAAGLCRIFRQDGYKVAPFKAQNMALNSFVTEEGLEMGRAQVVQAEAAGIRPTVAMNPILLKPNSNMGSQVIVEGEILGNYSAAEYYKLKKELVPVVEKSLKELSDQYDVIVIEGAGSPAEINLKEFDIVNMGMAKMAGAPVILVGDIDRGGVFASLYGTVKLLDEEEQAIIKGIVINKFRGDVELLNPGLKMIEEKVGIPVIGVIPMEEIDIEEEDSLADRLNRKGKGSGLDIAVIHLPHISNFTDFAVLERMNGVSVRYVETEDGLGVPDAIIIPGTKNTMSDLKWLRDSGLAEKITEFARLDIPVIGICGGFQMLGKRLSDPYGVEEKGTMEGLGLLDAKTVFSREKVRTQARARILEHIPGWPRISGMNVEGYEIHMGITRNLGDCRDFIDMRQGEEKRAERFHEREEKERPAAGLCSKDGSVWGTYLHGFFDAPGVAEEFVASIEEKKLASFRGSQEESDKKPSQEVRRKQAEKVYHGWMEYKEKQYDKLADLIRNSLDMEQVYRILDDGLDKVNGHVC